MLPPLILYNLKPLTNTFFFVLRLDARRQRLTVHSRPACISGTATHRWTWPLGYLYRSLTNYDSYVLFGAVIVLCIHDKAVDHV